MKKKPRKEVYTLSDLQSWRDTDPPIRLGVFGDPVEHSLSPQMQNAALKHCKIDKLYARFHILPDELREAITLIRKLEFVGVNLTVPHKIAALDLLDLTDDNVKRIGAVNIIKIEGAKVRGFNTDGRGFARAIREEFSVDLRDLRVMLRGAGDRAPMREGKFRATGHCQSLFRKSAEACRRTARFLYRPKSPWAGGAFTSDSVGRSSDPISNRTCRSCRECDTHWFKSWRSVADSVTTARAA